MKNKESAVLEYVIMLVIIDISEKNLFKKSISLEMRKLTSNKLKITLFQNLLEMN